MNRLANLARVAVVVTGALASIATSKVQSGERGDGECPAGEQCSDATPTGLYFGGMPTGDIHPLFGEWPQATALGGRQTIRMFYDADGEQPLDLPFDASLSTNALSIGVRGPNTVTVYGQEEGQAVLRITEPGTDLLYDRVSLTARAIETMTLVPAGLYWGDLDLWDGSRSFVVLAGAPVRITAAMYSANDHRVVDEGMQIQTGSSVARDPEGYLDTVLVTAPAGTVDLVVEATGITRTLPVEVVAAADTIMMRGDQGEPIAVSETGERRCFRAMSGGKVVLGARFTYYVSGPVEVTRSDDYVASRCIYLTATEPGIANVTVSGAGQTATFEIQLTDLRSARREEPLAGERSLAGDRAETAAME